jgi:parvulin-like peptidyl-prolyl isomerase
VSIVLLGILLVSCGESSPAQPSAPPQEKIVTEETGPALAEPTLAATAVPLTPTPTPEPPAAARVNGQIITLEDFEKEVARYEEAQRTLGRDPAASGTLYQVEVLDALIERLLIEQAAEAAGISISDEALEQELQRLIENSGGQENFDAWLEMSQYTLDEFRLILHSGMISQEMYEQVAMSTPDIVEQVHARHIVVDSAEIGELVLTRLQEGTDFATLAADYSRDESTRLNGGDLDFFPRGLLLSPEVEEAAFALEVGATSGLVTSSFGYHIIQVLEKDPARPVTPDIQQRLREITFGNWLQQLWATAMVERNI